jgi:hypothetical protein
MLLEKRFFSKCLQQVSAAARWGSNSSLSKSAAWNVPEIETFHFNKAKLTSSRRHSTYIVVVAAYIIVVAACIS